ncbi:BCCT family transporter [Thorsellia kenyensis]|uniref:BCCT family transporter n=1 Tax=Thorsellia kenyensis TaxID=1549888 RepID=A0ABV6C7C3_9GAMM
MNTTKQTNPKLRLRHLTFWPAFIMTAVAVIVSLTNGVTFAKATKQIVGWILDHFSWGFSLAAFGCVILCIIVFFSPLGNIRIGGKNATPILTRTKWIMIALCTTIAAGLLFWAAAEPLYHYYYPPKSFNIEATSPSSAIFSLSTMFLHWTFTPFAIYCVPALVFTLVYHNLNKPFSIGSMLYPVMGKKVYGKTGQVIDGIALSGFSASMASSMATGIIAIMGGLALYGVQKGSVALAGIGAAIAIVVTLSSVSGLKKGITLLSTVNTWVFMGIGIAIFVFGPTRFILNFSLESLGNYLDNFFQKSLITGAAEGESWGRDWTIFYFSSWMAWAPLTAMFLGKIARGYTVKEFLAVNLLIPSVFAGIWTSIFSGSVLYFDMTEAGSMKMMLDTNGYESVVYALINKLPFASILVLGFVFATFLSYCTAADSTTDAMANLCLESETGERLSEDSSSVKELISMKVLWGIGIGIVAVTMLVFADVEGIKQLAYIGGLPALVLCVGLLFSLIRLLFCAKELEACTDLEPLSFSSVNPPKPLEISDTSKVN